MLELSRGRGIAVSATLGASLVLFTLQSNVAAVQPAGTPVALRNPFASNQDAVRAGGKMFSAICVECHGVNGEGDLRGPALNTGGFVHGSDDADVFHTIRAGVAGTEMEPHPAYNDAETWQLVAYIRSLSGPPRNRTFTEQYCVSCHNDHSKTGGLSLVSPALKDIPAHSKIWEKVLRKVRSGEMPPAKAKDRPDTAKATAFADSLQTTLDHDAADHPNPGRAPVHRLNRAEYSNAIRDLLAVDVKPGEWLPVDDSGYGFDNIAAVLSTSPALLERYMSAARKISRLAVGDLTLKPDEEIYDAKTLPGRGDAKRAT